MAADHPAARSLASKLVLPAVPPTTLAEVGDGVAAGGGARAAADAGHRPGRASGSRRWSPHGRPASTAPGTRCRRRIVRRCRSRTGSRGRSRFASRDFRTSSFRSTSLVGPRPRPTRLRPAARTRPPAGEIGARHLAFTEGEVAELLTGEAAALGSRRPRPDDGWWRRSDLAAEALRTLPHDEHRAALTRLRRSGGRSIRISPPRCWSGSRAGDAAAPCSRDRAWPLHAGAPRDARRDGRA